MVCCLLRVTTLILPVFVIRGCLWRECVEFLYKNVAIQKYITFWLHYFKCGGVLSCSFVQWACLVLRRHLLHISAQILSMLWQLPALNPRLQLGIPPAILVPLSQISILVLTSNNVLYSWCIVIMSADSFAGMSGAPFVPLYLFSGPIASLLICIPKSPGSGRDRVPHFLCDITSCIVTCWLSLTLHWEVSSNQLCLPLRSSL